jgi:hypothetical protein
VEVLAPVPVPVAVEVDAAPAEPAEDVEPEPDQHEADHALERARDAVGQRHAESQHGPAEEHQGARVPDAPHGGELDARAERRGPRRQRRDGGHVVGLERVLHAHEEAEEQDRGHGAATFACLLRSNKAGHVPRLTVRVAAG